MWLHGGGYLARHTEKVAGETLTGAQIVQRVAEQYSVNPRLLLALLEHTGGWVDRADPSGDQMLYPLGFKRTDIRGLYIQLVWAAARLNEGYYGWRLGNRLWVRLDDGTRALMGDRINAGTAGLQNYLAAVNTRPVWLDALGDGPDTFIQTYRRMFGNPWQFDIGPLVPAGLKQPTLPCLGPRARPGCSPAGRTAPGAPARPGAHSTSRRMSVQGCTELTEWVTAVADGVVTRSKNGEVVQSLDPSGDDRIGWSILYLHIGSPDRVAVGARLKQGDRIGHPSCEGGITDGAHVHVVRRYNGEWLNAVGDVPLDLGGWTAAEGAVEYDGTLSNGKITREACECKELSVNGVGW